MLLKDLLEQCGKKTNREKSNMLFWALWTYAKTQKSKEIKNQCIYECYCLVNNYLSEWDETYKSFYERFLNLSVNEYDELKIGEDKTFKGESGPLDNEEKEDVKLDKEKWEKAVIAAYEAMKNSK